MTAPDFLPTSDQELWQRWLGYRFPHYDEMEEDAARTLLGTHSSTVRVGWNGALRRAAEWHTTLFTLAGETPNPEATLAAVGGHKPAGVVLHHVISESPRDDAPTPPDPRAATLPLIIGAALAADGDISRLARDHRARSSIIDAARARTTAQLDAARAATEDAIAAGLRARAGFTLIPTMVVKPEMLEDWFLYQTALAVRERLSSSPGDIAWRPSGIAVCRSCTTVFLPRRASAEYCDLCRKRPAQPSVIGQRPFAPGQVQTVRAPRLAGNVIVGWKTIAIGLCPECGDPFTGRSDATACTSCSPRTRQRRHRRNRTV